MTSQSSARWGLSLIAASILLRLFAIRSYAYDSDETQHLHVAWGWSRGLLQYRDLFDNHTPLFHMLSAPILRLTGERPESLDVMRLAMLPLALATIALVWSVARRLYSKEIAWWSAALLSWFPLFFFKTIEFRNDQPWLLCWTFVVAVLAAGPAGAFTGFVAGVAMGTAFAFSMKSVIFVATIAVAAGFAAYSAEGRSRFANWRMWASFAAGMLVVPSVIVGYFAARGAVAPLLYCVVTFNAGLKVSLLRRAAALLLLPAGMFAAGSILRRFSNHEAGRGEQRVFLLATSVVFIALTISSWPMLYPRVFVPALPPLAIVLTAIGIRRQSSSSNHLREFALALAIEAFLVVAAPMMWRFDSIEVKQTIADTLALTNPDDLVLDRKGETVFRPRAMYQVLETIALQKIREGKLVDDLIPSVISRRCTVAVRDSRFFPLADRKFLNEYFLPLRSIRVAGSVFAGPPSVPARFEIAIPSTYSIVRSDGRPADGVLDGVEDTGPRFLAAGMHVFVPHQPSQRFAAIWSRVLERGIPFRVPGRAQ